MTTQLNRLGGGKYIEKNPLSFNGGCSDLRSLLRSETHCTVLSLWSDEITSHPCSTLSSRNWVVGQVNHPYVSHVSSNLCIAALNVSLCWESRTDTIPWVADLPSLWGQGRSFVWGPSEHASRRGGQQLSPLKKGGGVIIVEDVWPIYWFFKWLTTSWFEYKSKDIPAQLQQI